MRLVRLVVVLVAAVLSAAAFAAPAQAWPPGQAPTANINSTTFKSGDTVTVTVQNVTPGVLTMLIFSAPVVIGTGTVGRNGSGAVSGAIPAGYSGSHTIQVVGAGGEVFTFAITVQPFFNCGSLAVTGPPAVQVDRHSVTWASLRYGRCADPGTPVIATATIGTWSATLTSVATQDGEISLSGTFTDLVHDLPLGSYDIPVTVQSTVAGKPSSYADSRDVDVITSTFSAGCAGTDGRVVSWSGTYLPVGLPFALISGGETLASGTVPDDGTLTLSASPASTESNQVLRVTYFDEVIDSATVTVATSCASSDGGLFRSLSPTRILDTRAGNGAPKVKVAPNATLSLQVTGRGGVPASGVAAVVLNTTVTNPTGSGFITAFPAGTAKPTASSLNFVARQTVANAVTVPVGTDGRISLTNSSGGTVDLVTDVAGYFLAGTPTQAGAFTSLTPARLLDTRTGNGAPKAKIGAGRSLTLQVGGRGGVPTTGVSAVVMNATVTNPTGNGYLTVFPGGTRPTASSLNFAAGRTVPNAVTVTVSSTGTVTLYNGSSGTVDIVVDISGYYRAGTPTAAGAFRALTPTRVLDTRNANGAPKAPVARQATLTVQLTGRGGLPATGVAAVVLNTTVTTPTGNGYLTVHPAGTTRPIASTLNFVAGQTIANAVTVPPNSTGAVAFYNGSSGSANFIADLAGYYLTGA